MINSLATSFGTFVIIIDVANQYQKKNLQFFIHNSRPQ